MKKMCDELVQAVQAKMGEEYEVTVNEVMKVNDTKKTGLTISKVGEEQQGIHPIVYIDDLACEVCDGSTSIDDAVQKVIELYESADADEVVAEGDISNIFQNADDCLSRVRLRIVNKNLCKKMLADKVSRDFLDLVIYYQINVREDSNGFASVPVTVGLAKMLGVTEDDLYTAAINNMKGEEVVEDMATVLNKLIGEDDDRCIEENGFGAPPMLVITNKSGVYGASQMMNQDVMDQISRMLGNCYIIPSSIHELIALPLDTTSRNDLKSLICEVNEGHVMEDEVLSDHPYIFDATKKELVVA